jgi:hypothetical protein
MTPSVNIAFTYTTDPLVVAALKEFRVYVVDPNSHVRQTGPVVIQPSAIPLISKPLNLAVSGYGAQMVEITPVDLQGIEGTTTYVPVHILLPGVSGGAQVTA